MITREIIIQNKLGMHARAAAKFVNLASTFESSVEVERGNRKVNGKSIMGVMMLAASKGTGITVHTHGEDEADAIEHLEELINNKFGEDE